MRGKRFLHLTLRVILTSGLFSFLFLICLSSQAEQIRYPVPCYEGEELEKVRQWEKTWIGQKIDPRNIDEVKEFIPESLYQMIKDPETWGESWFEIVPYREIKPSKGELSFTGKYAGTCSIGADEEICNYVCGIPFPNPKTGLEIAYNFENLNQGDNTHSFQDIYIINGKNRSDRKMVWDSRFLFFQGGEKFLRCLKLFPTRKEFIGHRMVHTMNPPQ